MQLPLSHAVVHLLGIRYFDLVTLTFDLLTVQFLIFGNSWFQQCIKSLKMAYSYPFISYSAFLP